MNANELADELDIHVSMGQSKFFKECATMLRQQQALIEALRRHREWIEETAVKELTDEEWIATYQTWLLTSNDPLVLKQAILRKAQEK